MSLRGGGGGGGGAAWGLPAAFIATSCEAIIISKSSFEKKQKLYWGPATLACYTGFFSKSTQERLRGRGTGKGHGLHLPFGTQHCPHQALVTQGENCPWTPCLFTVTGHTEKSFRLLGGWGETAGCPLGSHQPGVTQLSPASAAGQTVLDMVTWGELEGVKVLDCLEHQDHP